MTTCTNCGINLGMANRTVLKGGKLLPVCSEECARELARREREKTAPPHDTLRKDTNG